MRGPGRWLRYGGEPKAHVCPKPGWRERWKVGAREGARWMCHDCRQVWEWKYAYYDDGLKSWNRVELKK